MFSRIARPFKKSLSLIFIPVWLILFVETCFSTDWLTDWQKRISLLLDNTSSLVSDCQVLLTTTTFSSIQWNDIKGGTGKSDFSDVRFTKSDGVTLLNYWIAFDTTTPESFWIKFAGELPTGTTTIYLYYGNQACVSVSSGPLTFDFFDDFEEPDFRSFWTVGEEWSIIDGKAKHNRDDTGWRRAIAVDTGEANGIIETKVKGITSPNDGDFVTVFIRNSDGIYPDPRIIQFTLFFDFPIKFLYADYGSSKTYITPGPSFDKWYRIKFAHNNENIKVYVDSGAGYELKITSTTTHTTGTHVGVAGRCCESYADYFFQRKYVSEDPTIVISTTPELSWTAEAGYTTDGLEPETGTSTMSYTYKVRYTDFNNDDPLGGYPKLHIKKGGIEIAGSPFTMSYVTGDNETGADYSYSLNLSSGMDYTYYFEAYDQNSLEATGLPTSEIDNPDVSGWYPTLTWTDEAGYTSDGVEPDAGIEVSFVYKVKYTDLDNDPPAAGTLKLHIEKGIIELPGSPYALSEDDPGDTVYSDGKIYTYTKALFEYGSDYRYRFEAGDRWNWSAIGVATSTYSGPVVSSRPVLSWIGEAGYTTNGLEPETGTSTMSYTYKIQYTDYLNIAPGAGCPKVHIKKDEEEIPGSPISMNYVTGLYNTGAAFSTSTVLIEASTSYSYYFEVYNIFDVTGTPTSECFGPKVGNQPVLTWTGETNYTECGVYPVIGKPNTDTFVFRVKHTDQDNNTPLGGYPKLHIKKGGMEITGSPFSMSYVSGDYETGAIYSYELTFSTSGSDYLYYFETYDQLIQAGSITTQGKLFTVTNPPTLPENRTIIGNSNQLVITAKFVLSWYSEDPDGDTLTYYLYVGKSPITTMSIKPAQVDMQLVYSGPDTSYTLYSLDPGSIYSWRVDVEDSNGVKTQGNVFNFKTLSIEEDKVFNYPNPFNPKTEKTNIVFYARDTGTAEINIWTEFGEKVFEDRIDVLKGTSEYPYDGRDSDGNILMNGTYVVSIKVDNKIKKSVILVLKR